MQLVLNTKSMIENQNGGKKNESIRCRICKEFYPRQTMDGSRDGTREMAETFPIVSGWKKWKP